MHPQSIQNNTNFTVSKRPENTPILGPIFSGKEKDSETVYYYFGARYYNPDLSLWLSVDPMADKYPSLSPYNYCAWNPLKLVDPDGSETIDNDDIVIKGSNNSSLTIKTSAVDITLHTKQDLKGNHVIDARSKQAVIGYEVGGDATGSAVFQSSGSVYKQSVMFLSGDYSGYWYDYVGGEAQMNVSNSAEGTIGLHDNFFIGFYSGSADEFTPKSFAGSYFGADGGISGNILAVGITLDGSWAKSKDGKWKTFSVGSSFSIGPQVDLGSGVIGGYGGGNLGGIKLVTPEKRTKDRSFFDRMINTVTHKPFF